MSDETPSQFTTEQAQRAAAVKIAADNLVGYNSGLAGGKQPPKMKHVVDLAEYICTGTPFTAKFDAGETDRISDLIDKVEGMRTRDRGGFQAIPFGDLPEELQTVIRSAFQSATEDDGLGGDPKSNCPNPDCPIHGDSDIAKARRAGAEGNN